MPRAPLAPLALSLALAAACGSGGDDGPRAAAPTFSPAAPWNFREQAEVTIATATPGATIHYTLDGSAPGAASPAYEGPLVLTATTTVRAVAVADGLRDSPAASATFTRRAVDLALDDGGGEVVLTLFGDEAAPAVGFVNRFTPSAAEFPFELRVVRVLFPAQVAVGAAHRLAWYSDPDGVPENGATLEGTLDVTAQANDGATWSVYALPAPATLTGPGDVLVALVATGASEVTCLEDRTTVSGRTLHAWWADPADAPALPPSWALQASAVGNALIRASN